MKNQKLKFLAVLTLIVFSAFACAKQELPNQSGETVSSSKSDEGFVCRQWISSNQTHLSEGRAEKASGWFTPYLAVGSKTNLGYWSTTSVTLKETAPGYFEKGECSAVNPITYTLSLFKDLGDASEGIAFDGNGFVYITSYLQKKIKKLDSSGSEILKTNGQSFVEGIPSPSAIGFNKDGNLFAASYSSNKVFHYDAQGNLVNEITGYETKDYFGNIKTTAFNGPNGLTVSSKGDVFVGDMGSGKIIKISGGKGTVLYSSAYKCFNGLALSKDEKTLFALESVSYGYGAIHKITLDDNGNFVKAVSTTPKKALPILDGIALDINGDLYVTYNKKDIARVKPDTGEVEVLYNGTELHYPANIAFGYGAGFDSKTIYITQVGQAIESAKAGDTLIQKMLIHIEGMVLPIFN